MTHETVLGGTPLYVAIDTETHVDFIHGYDTVHAFHRPVAFLAGNPGPDMRLVHEFYEVRQSVNPVPADFERRLMVIGPCLGDWLDTTQQRTSMTSDASLDRRHSGSCGAARVLVAVLTRYLVNTGVHPMAEGNWLVDI
jgi:hypothetical protein